MATSHIPLPLVSIPDATNPPAVAYTTGRQYLLFGTAVDQLMVWTFRMPDDFASDLTVKWQYSMVSASTNNVAIRSEIMAANIGENIDFDLYDTLEKSADATVPAVSGNMGEISTTLAETDGLLAGGYVAIRLGRENGTTGTNATGDMEVWSISLSYTTT